MMDTVFSPVLKFEYKNYNGEISSRIVIPYKPWFGKTEHHKEEQWLLHAYDIEKCAERNFALKDIIKFL